MTEIPGAGLLGQDVFVENDGRMLRTMIRGAGEDLVVLESGLGVSGLAWGPVHEHIAAHARVVAYERAGFGGSEPDTAPRDLARLADDLLAVVRSVPHRRLVLVGHSWGGPIVRTAAARLLAEGASVDGLVLVDQSDEHADMFFSWLFGFGVRMQRTLMPMFARLRLLAPLIDRMVVGLDEPLRSAVVRASASLAAARESAAEYRHVAPDLQTLLDRPLDLAETPMTVISGLATPKHGADQRAAIVAAHRRTAAQHPGARFVAAELSEHQIPLTEPELIAAEAVAMLATA